MTCLTADIFGCNLTVLSVSSCGSAAIILTWALPLTAVRLLLIIRPSSLTTRPCGVSVYRNDH